MKLWLDWVSLPELFGWTTNQPDLQKDITIATVFGQRYAVRVVQLYLWEAWYEAMVYGFVRLLMWTRSYLVKQIRP